MRRAICQVECPESRASLSGVKYSSKYERTDEVIGVS
jgi:hypothetical protein